MSTLNILFLSLPPKRQRVSNDLFKQKLSWNFQLKSCQSWCSYDHQITADTEVKVTSSLGRALKAEKLRKIAAGFCQQFTSELQQHYQDLI